MIECRLYGVNHDTVTDRKARGVPKKYWFVKKLPWSSTIPDDAPATFYIYDVGSFIGFGVSKDFKSRDKTHRRNCKKVGVSLELAKTYERDGAFIKELEREIKSIFADKIINTGIEGFKTEALPLKYKEGIINLCEIFMEQGL